ncbi:MAG: ABC transporter permease subunit [Candidatus Hodarchaeales archaeon]|jgi:ABC-type transport system involved in multi-copper enzyme maturation permease subunit
MSFINKNYTNLLIESIKKDRWILIGLFAVIFFLVFITGIAFPVDDLSGLQGFDEMLENPILQVLLGPLVSLSSLQGWFAVGWFSISWWIGVPFALYLGIQIFSIEISQGTADHLLTAPVSRREILVTRYVSSALKLLTIPLANFLAIYLTYLALNIEFPYVDAIGVIFIDYVFFLTTMSFTLFISLLLVEIKRSVMLTGAIYIFSYFLQTFGSLNPDLKIFKSLSIFEARPFIDIYVNSATEKILPNLAILVVLSLLLLGMSYFVIERVEIRKR